MDTLNIHEILIEPIIEMLDNGGEKILAGVLITASLIAVINLMSKSIKGVNSEAGTYFSDFIGQILKYGFIFGIVKLWNGTIIPMLYDLFASIGNLFGEGFGNPLNIHSVWLEGWSTSVKLLNVGIEMGGLWAFAYIVFFLLSFICLCVIIGALTISILQFHIVMRLAPFFLAFLMMDVLSDIGKKCINSVVNVGTDLMVTVALGSMCFAVIKKLSFPEGVSKDNNMPQVVGVYLLVWIVSALLVWFHDKIAGLIISGQGGLSSADFGKAAATVVGLGATAAGATIKQGGKLSGKLAQAVGDKMSKSETFSTAGKILSGGGKAIEKGTEWIGEGTFKLGEGISRSIEYASGSRNLASDTANKAAETIKNLGRKDSVAEKQKEHEGRISKLEEANRKSNEGTSEGTSEGTEKNEKNHSENFSERKDSHTAENENKEQADNQKGSSFADTGKAESRVKGENTGSSSRTTSNANEKSSNSAGNKKETGTANAGSKSNSSEKKENQGASATAGKTADTSKAEGTLGGSSNKKNQTFTDEERERYKSEKTFADEEKEKFEKDSFDG